MASPRRIQRLLAPAVLALAVLAPAASAQDWFDAKGVRALVETPWPGSLGKGYLPFWIELENGAAEPRRAEITLECQGYNSPTLAARRELVLEPGEKRTVEIFAPSFTNPQFWAGQFTFELRVDGDRTRSSLDAGPQGWQDDVRTFVLFTSERTSAGLVDQLAERLKTEDVQGWSPTKGSGKYPNVRAGVAPFERMPSRYEAYTSLDAVVVDARRGLPPAERLEPLLAWARLGGRIVILGDDTRNDLRRHPGVGVWLEDRFLVRRSESGPLTAGGTHAFGLGFLGFAGAYDGWIESAEEVEMVRWALAPPADPAASSSWIPFSGDWRLSKIGIEIPGVGELPLRTFMLILLLFALVIGPLNLAVLKKLRRPGLFLLTVPTLSFLASSGLVLYGILYQGVDVKSASHSLTLLDQRTHRAATIERRAMFVGLSPGPGLVPTAGTSVYPEQVGDDSERYEIDFTRGLLLEGTFLPVREPVRQIVLSEGADRNRLSVVRDGETIEIHNTLPVSIQALVVRDEQGAWYQRDEPLASGERGSVLPLDRDGFRPQDSLLPEVFLAEHNPMLLGRSLPPASYAAILADSPFRDPCGLEPNELEGRHSLIGILPAREEEWE